MIDPDSNLLSPNSTTSPSRVKKKRSRLSKLISPISNSPHSAFPTSDPSTLGISASSADGSSTHRSPSSPRTMSSFRANLRNRSRTPPRARSSSVASQSPVTPPVPPIAAEFIENRPEQDDAESEPDGPIFIDDRRIKQCKCHVPYPVTVTRALQDHDAHETERLLAHLGSPSFIQFPTPPTRVLDLGCGTGSWLIAAASQWKHARLVGLDIEPSFPDLEVLELINEGIDSPYLSFLDRLEFVQADLLQELPFRDNEFDFVHIKGVAAGVPEDKWPSLFAEITRILRPGGVLEMIENTLHWPLPLNHQLLGQAYEGLFESRFINITPLRVIPSSINMYLNGLHTIEFEDNGDMGLPWRIAVNQNQKPTRARSSSLTLLVSDDHRPRAASAASYLGQPIFPSSPSYDTTTNPHIFASSSSSAPLESLEWDNDLKAALALLTARTKPDPHMMMYQSRQLTFILATGPHMREHWLARGGDADSFDKAWRALQQEMLVRRKCANVMDDMAAFPNYMEQPPPPPRRKKKKKPPPPTPEPPVRRETKVFLARKAL